MSYFFVIVVLSLCTMMMQATPMMNQQGQNPQAPSSIEQQQTKVQNPQPLNGQNQIPPAVRPLEYISSESAELTKKPTPSELEELNNDVKRVHCDVCKEQCQCKLDQVDSAQPEKKPEERKHGWGNGLKNAARWVYKVLYTNLVGPKGVLTTLLDTKPKKPNKTKSKSRNSNDKSNGKDNGQAPSRVMACCVFYGNGPPVKDDDDEDKKQEEDETDNEAPPVNCFWLFNKIRHQTTTTPGQSTAVPPVAPGGKSVADNRSINCFTGSHLVKITKFIKVNFLAKFNCCAADVTLNVGTVS